MLYRLGCCLLSHDIDAVRAGLLPPVSGYRCCTGCVITNCGDMNVTSESRCYELIFSVGLDDTQGPYHQLI